MMDRSGAAHRDRTRQDIKHVTDGAPAALHRHPFQLLGDEHEQRHKKGREELADGRGRDHGETHREFHRHAPLGDVRCRLRENGPAAEGEAKHPKDAGRCEGFPDTPPEGRGGERDKTDTQHLGPCEGRRMVVAVFVVMLVVMLIMPPLTRGSGCRAYSGLLSEGVCVRVGGHRRAPCYVRMYIVYPTILYINHKTRARTQKGTSQRIFNILHGPNPTLLSPAA